VATRTGSSGPLPPRPGISPSSRLALAAVILVGIIISGLAPLAQPAPGARRPGRLAAGLTLLPNGWTIAPAGFHTHIGDLPLAQAQSPDGRYLVVTNNGWSKPTLAIYDLKLQYITARVPLDHAWLGLAWHPDGTRLYSSGAAQNTVHEYAYSAGTLKKTGDITIAAPDRAARVGGTGGEAMDGVAERYGFVGGLSISPDGSTLYAVQVLGKKVSAIDVATRTVRKTIELAAEPYTSLVSPNGKTLFVSLWGGAKVLLFDAQTLEPIGEVAVGEHPNALQVSKDGRRLFVACANTNAVWVIDLASGTAKEQVSVALYPKSPAGTTPNALSLSPDGETLLVANADNNTVAVIDVKKPGVSEVEGFIPTGWYPTSVQFDRDGSRLFVLSGKGLTSMANPRGPVPGDRGMEGQYSGGMMQGSLSILPRPDKTMLQAYTARVYDITAYSDRIKLTPANAPADSPIPRKVGERSPIKYVFYVIRENRTYDQIFGDLPQGNGDANLAIFGETITPNAHALAKEFALFDNFYVDAEVSYDGHAFSTAAYATDVVEKLWPTNYGGRGAVYLSEGGGEQRNPYGNIAAPADGYLWDFAARAGVSYRSYGEFTEWKTRGQDIEARVPGLVGHVHPTYPPWDLTYTDNQRIDIWLEEFEQFERDGNLPRLNIVRLPNDHTAGTRPGAWTPRAMLAENDLALGRFVEAISHSRYWAESAIFVLEDDAQNGPDHVDAHRSPMLAISPFIKRRTVDSTLYTTSGVLRTMELILGLPPMSQYDAAAAPLYAAFQARANAAPYTHLAPTVSITERNGPDAPGAQASMRMNMEEADLTPELELNEIVWRSIRGHDARMPPPVRSGFIRSVAGDDDDDPDEPD
jgi:YVTN family beta-propeller protein